MKRFQVYLFVTQHLYQIVFLWVEPEYVHDGMKIFSFEINYINNVCLVAEVVVYFPPPLVVTVWL